ncbi:oligoendopeptidase F [uncultured Thomasclavelia sp.]|uniref:oligoendopeptidase F n=1 Tax=uncultured Thomasclavelia sp. TaxID=3025759 RepID=UPI0025D617EA|nr:oligoendopeptidase F [uncultured Thomasclavelia sp.]
MERKDIDVKDTWDLSTLYSSDEAFYQDIDQAKSLINDLVSYKGKICNTIDSFYHFMETKDQVERIINKLYCYAHLNCDVEPNNQTYQTMLAAVMGILEASSVQISFIDNEIIDHESEVLSYIKDPKLNKYTYKIKSLLSYKDHILPKEQEELLAKVDSIADTSSQVFDAFRLEYEDVIENGKAKTLNNATLNKFLKSKDAKVRKQAYTNFFKEYRRYENVFAQTLSGVMKKDAFYANVRKFDNSLEASVFDDDVPSDLFFKVLDSANNKYRHLFHRYNHLKKELLHLDTLYNYDLNIPLVKSITKKYTIDQCFEIINQCLKPFGDEYLEIINKARQERWIDYYPTPGKRIGAYSSGCYDSNPFILMNFIGDYNSLSTMIHELGHSVHSYLSNHYQEPVNAGYRIFVAEVASTVNETLLINYMINNAKTDQEKAYFIYEQLENCVGLIFRQPMFADFEYRLHTMAENNEPLSSKVITDLYAKLNQEYYGPDVTLDELVGWSCYYVPHFYYNYYVYKYTLGMTVALAIVKRILNGDQKQVTDYLSFLKSGGSMAPVDLLKKAGVDPLDDQIYEDAFAYFEELLNQFENIMK